MKKAAAMKTKQGGRPGWRALGRFAPRQFRKRAAGHRPQPLQRDVSFFHALHELFSDILSALMVAAVWQTSADFLKHYVHFRGYPFFDFGHLTPRLVIDANGSARTWSPFVAKGVGVLLCDSPTKL
jgi:hypothetical protein